LLPFPSKRGSFTNRALEAFFVPHDWGDRQPLGRHKSMLPLLVCSLSRGYLGVFGQVEI